MILGSTEHKTQFVEEKVKIHHENIWAMEIQLLYARKELTTKKAYLDLIPGKMERKEYGSASEGKQDEKNTKADIATLESEVTRIEGDIRTQEIAIQKTQQWAEQNGK